MIVRAFKRKAVTAMVAVSAVGGLLAGCSSSSADNDAEKTGDGSQNKVIGASEGPSAAPSTLATGMGSDNDTDGTFPRTVTHFEG